MYISGIDKENFEAVKGFFPKDTEGNLDKPGFYIYAAAEEGAGEADEVLGVLSFFIEKPEEENEIRIDWLYVRPESRRKRVASSLLEELSIAAEKEEISLTYAELPDVEEGETEDDLTEFFTHMGFELDEYAVPRFEGTIGELRDALICKRINRADELWDAISEEDGLELSEMFYMAVGGKMLDREVTIDLTDENKLEIFERLFEDCSATIKRVAVREKAPDTVEEGISVDEAMLLLRQDAAYIMPRFTALINLMDEEEIDYEVGGDSDLGPYIVFPQEVGDFDVKLYISLDPDDSESYAVSLYTDFDIKGYEIDETLERLNSWEDEALYATGGVLEADRKVFFNAGIPCTDALPSSEDIKTFAESFAYEVKTFLDMKDE